MRSYRETFRRHRLLYLLPALILAIAVGAIAYKAPKQYASTASLWVDNEASTTSSLDVGPTTSQAEQPSSVELTLLDELIVTSKFDNAVVAGARLGHSTAAANSTLAASIPTGVVAGTPGPQVVQVTYTGSSPVIAQVMVQSLVTQLQSFTQQFGRQFSQAAIAFDQTQKVSAEHAIASAKTALSAYQAAHPGSTTQNDPAYASLVSAESSATASLSSSATALNQAEAQGSAGGPTASVLGQPTFNAAPLSGKKKVVEYAFAAGVAGLLLSLILIVILTAGGEDEWDDELSEPGLAVDAVISLPSGGPRPGSVRKSGVVRASDTQWPVRFEQPPPPPTRGASSDRSHSPRPLPQVRERPSLPRFVNDLTRRSNKVGDDTDQPVQEGRA